MKASQRIAIGFAVLLLAVVPLLAAVWSAPDALASDETSLWSSPDVLASIQPGLKNDEVKQAAENKLDRVKKNLREEVSYSYEQAFRVYSLADIDIIKAFEEKGSLGECVSTSYKWHVPLVSGGKTVASAKLAAQKDGSWQVVSYGDAQLEEHSLLSDLNRIAEQLASKSLKNVTDIRAAYLPLYHTTMLYIKADGQEYAMAANEARFTDIVTYEVYTAKDFVGAFERAFGKPVPLDPKTPLEEIPFGIPGAKTR